MIIHGDSKEMLKTLDANSVDTIITDPPYGLSFMGKKWDYDVPGVELWKECLRVLKPGGTALIFAGSRTQHRMACNVEDAGFILKDCIMWLYGSGFPKATDIAKQIDKKKGITEWKQTTPNPAWRKGNGKGATTSTGWQKPQRPPKPVVETPEAQLWNGWKSHGLKPAYEPILVAMKPNDGSYAENALKHGVSGLNIDGGRIEGNWTGSTRTNSPESKQVYGEYAKIQTEQHSKGRFPANIILDEEAGQMLDEQSGVLTSGKMNSIAKGNQYNTYGKMYERKVTNPASKGGASRFFYCAKASKAERNKGCEGLEEKVSGGMAGTADQTLLTGSGNIRNNKSKNHHPTVKPLKLMEYLCTLTKTPTGGVVLDPFMGSGTTGCACKNTGREFIGIELNEEYVKIAKARVGG